MRETLRSLRPVRQEVDRGERLRAACGALLGILLTGLAGHALLGTDAGVLIAPMGASAVLLFALPASPLAQPWPILAGNTVSALIGVSCALVLGSTPLAAAVAMAGALVAMFALRCLHPPGGAIALSAVLGGPALQALGYGFVLAPVGLNSLLLLCVALAFNNATRRPYPHRQPPSAPGHGTGDAAPNERLGFTRADLDAVLRQYNQVLDVSRDDLDALFCQTEMQAYRRRFGEITCGDIMSRDLVTVEYGTGLEDAWALLRDHRIKALPVVDRARRVIGILTMVDFMKHAGLGRHEGFEHKLRAFLRRSGRTHGDKPEVVGQIMTAPVQTAGVDRHIVELVPLLSDLGLHHIPVIDHERRLVGIVTQSDLVAALYRGRLTG
nr:HPP family protein [Caldimonas tepidiphila]